MVVKEETVITKEEVEHAIQEKIPIGSSISQVNSFLDTLNVNSRTIRRESYREGVPVGMGCPDDPDLKVKGYIGASIPDARVIEHLLYSDRFWIIMHFYFDEKDRMVGHKLNVLGTV